MEQLEPGEVLIYRGTKRKAEDNEDSEEFNNEDEYHSDFETAGHFPKQPKAMTSSGNLTSLSIEDISFECSDPFGIFDISFEVEGQYLYASKSVLQMWSPVFNAMFSGAFREKKEQQIKLEGKLYDDVNAFFKVLHPPGKDVDEENVQQLLPLAHEYQISKVLNECEQILMKEEFDVKHLSIADHYGLSALRKLRIGQAERLSYSEFKSLEGLDDLPTNILQDLMHSLLDKMNSELEDAHHKQGSLQSMSNRQLAEKNHTISNLHQQLQHSGKSNEKLRDRAHKYEELLSKIVSLTAGGSASTTPCKATVLVTSSSVRAQHNRGKKLDCPGCCYYITRMIKKHMEAANNDPLIRVKLGNILHRH